MNTKSQMTKDIKRCHNMERESKTRLRGTLLAGEC